VYVHFTKAKMEKQDMVNMECNCESELETWQASMVVIAKPNDDPYSINEPKPKNTIQGNI